MPTKPPPTPEIPAEIENRPAIALTHLAAEEGAGVEREGTTDAGKSGYKPPRSPAQQAHTAKLKAQGKANAGKKAQSAKSARAAFNELLAAEPHTGLTIAQIMEISGRKYPGQPAMDPNLGDRTQAFVNWLCKHHPKDAAVRFYTRDIFPTE